MIVSEVRKGQLFAGREGRKEGRPHPAPTGRKCAASPPRTVVYLTPGSLAKAWPRGQHVEPKWAQPHWETPDIVCWSQDAPSPAAPGGVRRETCTSAPWTRPGKGTTSPASHGPGLSRPRGLEGRRERGPSVCSEATADGRVQERAVRAERGQEQACRSGLGACGASGLPPQLGRRGDGDLVPVPETPRGVPGRAGASLPGWA